MEQILRDLDQELARATLNDKTSIDINVLTAVINELTKNYSHYRRNISDVFSSLNLYEEESFALLLSVFRIKMFSVLKKGVSQDYFPVDAFEYDYSLAIQYLDKTMPQLENLTSGLLDVKINLSDVTKREEESFLSYLDILIDKTITKGDFNKTDIEDVFSTLILAKQSVLSRGLEEWYMLKYNLFIEAMQKYGFSQFARDHCETLLQFSFEVKKPEFGFYSSHNIYAKQSNAIFSLLYGLLCFEIIIRNDSISEKLLKSIYYKGLLLYRNIRFDQFLEELIAFEPENLSFTEYEKQSHHLTYFNYSLSKLDNSTLSKSKLYLDKKREDILLIGADATEPWISFLLNCKAFFPDIFQNTELQFYLDIFKNTISKDRYKFIESITVGNEDVEDLFEVELNKVLTTRHKSDYVFDNNTIIVLANNFIKKGYKENNVRAFLKGMLAKADNSVIFKNTIVEDFTKINSIGEMNFDSEIVSIKLDRYGFTKKDLENNILFLCGDNHNYYSLNLTCNDEISQLNNWGERSENLIDKIVGSLITSHSFYNSIRNYFIEDFEGNYQLFYSGLMEYFIDNLQFKETFVVKDINTSGYPHNLLLDKNQRFIFPENGVCDIVSREWFIKKNKKTSKASTIGVYLPINSGDILYNKIHSSIQPILTEYHVNQYLDTDDLDNIGEDIQIVISHGKNDISRFPAIYTSDRSIRHAYNSISSGKLLIMLICHSGSNYKSFMSNKVDSLAKLFLEEKFETVIAPFWALNSDIISLWLDTFLMHLNEGTDVLNAHKHGCIQLKENYPSPYLYSCLHLYGNPYLKMK